MQFGLLHAVNKLMYYGANRRVYMGLAISAFTDKFGKKLHYFALVAFMGLSSLLAMPIVKAEGVITIDSCLELQSIGTDDEYPADAEYELGGNIDCSDSWQWDENSGFQPIGYDYSEPFTGEFNGKGYAVSGLTIDRPYTKYMGLFGHTVNAVITDVNLRNATIKGEDSVGGLIGVAEGTTIQRVSVMNTNGTAKITANGEGEGESINGNVGGLVGILGGGSSISDSYARTEIVSNYEGFVRFAGGLVGYTSGASGSISNSYSVPTLTGTFDADEMGPLVGDLYYDTELVNSFWDSTVYTSSDGATSLGNSGNGRTTSWLKTQSNLVGAGWNFSSVWKIDSDNNGYPSLRAPSSGVNAETDKNGDGVADAGQENVSALTSTVSGKTVVLEMDDSCSVSEAVMKSVVENTKQDSGYTYPQGLMDFTAVCGAPGFTSTINQYYYDVELGTLSLRKYNPVTQKYSAITGASVSQQVIYGQNVLVASYEVTDGGPLDADGTANGTIVDPAGLASLVPGAPNTGMQRQNHIVVPAVIAVTIVLASVLLVATQWLKRRG